MNYWLMKTEPDNFSIHDLETNKIEPWDGVRNYQARNFMRDQMKRGDIIFIYHSSCKNIGIAGLATVSKESYPDPTQFDKKSRYYDPKASLETPRWFLVDVKWKETFKEVIKLEDLKKIKDLKDMHLVKKGTRLSIQPVLKDEFDTILNTL
jgi:predicted RNA-binding protein with PUA-like domain